MREVSYAHAITEALREEMARDESVFLMGEDVRMGVFGSTRNLVNEFGPRRILDTPISEAGFAGAGTGAAMAGMRPVVEFQMATFMYCAWDQICNQAAKFCYMSGGQMHVPVTFRTVYGVLGQSAAQHSLIVYPQLLNVPGLKIAVPASPADAKGLLKMAIRDDDPVIVFEHGRLGGLRGPVPEGEYLVPFGNAAVRRDGTDVTVVAIGYMVVLALRAAEELSKSHQVSVEVIDPRTLVPFDKEAVLTSLAKTRRLVIVDEAPLTGSAANTISAMVAEEGYELLEGPIRRVCGLDVPIPFAPAMEAFVLPDELKITEAVLAAVRGRPLAKGTIA